MTDDLLERVRTRARDNSFWRYLGVEVMEAGDGRVRLRVPARDDLRNAPGAPLHGGVFSALVDISVGGALSTMHEAAAVQVLQSGGERQADLHRLDEWKSPAALNLSAQGSGGIRVGLNRRAAQVIGNFHDVIEIAGGIIPADMQDAQQSRVSA